MKKFIVISHTHWDREWYMTFSSFRLKLVDLVDKLLALFERDNGYIFHLDAQTVVLEDYLVMRPQNEDLLKKYIASGNLRVGPWYLQNDFYLSDGEATVRNLMIGTALANKFGKCGSTGYAPDHFGNIAQLPQILSQFGIKDFVFGRGFKMHETVNGERREVRLPAEFEWVGADGTRMLAVHLKYWYNNAQHIPSEKECAQLLLDINERNFEGLTVSPYILLMNGVDHLEAQEDVREIIEGLKKEGRDIEQTSLDDYLKKVRAAVAGKELQSYRGALNKGCDYDTLKGCWSSRVYLKCANVKAQDLLLAKLEPLYSYLSAGGFDIYPENELHWLWKELLRNLPHDSICGCSNDPTHRHMEDRYELLHETGEDLLERGLKTVAAHLPHPEKKDQNYSVTLFNGTSRVQSGVAEAEINFLLSENVGEFDLVDGKGNSVPYEIVAKERGLLDVFSPLNLPGVLDVEKTRIAFYARNVPPFSAEIFAAVPRRTGRIVCADKTVGIGNEYYAFEIDGNALNIRDKRTGKLYCDPVRLQDSFDKGDAYVYRLSPYAPVSVLPARIAVSRQSALKNSVSLYFEYYSSARYDFDRDAPSEETVHTEAVVTLTLEKNSPVICAEYRLENRACDHRLRILLDAGISSGRIFTDGAYDYAERLPFESCDVTDSDTHHNATFARLSGEEDTLTVYTQGQHETEIIGGGLALTLVRATGVINRDAKTFRPTGGKQWDVPQNQCLRTLEGKIGWSFGESGTAADCFERAKFFRNGFLVHADSFDTKKYSGGRFAVQAAELEKFYYVDDPYSGKNIPARPLFTYGAAELAVTCCKKAEQGGVAVRIVNLSDNEVSDFISFCGKIYRTGMSERENEYLGEGKCRLTWSPKQVITLRLVAEAL